MPNKISRDELAILLDNEGWLSAAERIRCGEHPRIVLGEMRPFIGRYNDANSREAVQIFREVCIGVLEVTS